MFSSLRGLHFLWLCCRPSVSGTRRHCAHIPRLIAACPTGGFRADPDAGQARSCSCGLRGVPWLAPRCPSSVLVTTGACRCTNLSSLHPVRPAPCGICHRRAAQRPLQGFLPELRFSHTCVLHTVFLLLRLLAPSSTWPCDFPSPSNPQPMHLVQAAPFPTLEPLTLPGTADLRGRLWFKPGPCRSPCAPLCLVTGTFSLCQTTNP